MVISSLCQHRTTENDVKMKLKGGDSIKYQSMQTEKLEHIELPHAIIYFQDGLATTYYFALVHLFSFLPFSFLFFAQVMDFFRFICFAGDDCRLRTFENGVTMNFNC